MKVSSNSSPLQSDALNPQTKTHFTKGCLSVEEHNTGLNIIIDITGTYFQNKGYNIVKIVLSVVTRTDVKRVFVNVDVRCAGVARPYDGEAREVVSGARVGPSIRADPTLCLSY